MSLRFRLNLMITLTMLIFVVVGGLFVIHNARRSVQEEVRSSLNMVLQLIDAALANARADDGPSIAWIGELARLKKTRHLRIHVQQAPEKVIKLVSPPRPQVNAPAWFAWAVLPKLMVGEKQVERPDGRPIHIRVEANPDDEVAEAWNEAEDFLYLIGALAVTVSALVYFMLGRAFQSVGIILQGLGGIEQGDYAKRLPRFALPEFDRISRAFNHTAQALSKSRAENRALTQHSLGIQEEERRYIAQELHDEMGQSLSAIKAMAASLRKSADPDNGEAVESIIDQCDRLFAVARSLMRQLRPMLLDDLGLIASLEDMIENWRDRNPGVNVEFRCEGEIEECAGNAKIHLYRIVQECLSNVIKHAEARRVKIRFRLSARETPCRIILTVIDDGRGFDPDQPLAGFGLLGMKERAASLGGEFILKTHPGGGVMIEARIPCAEEGR